MATHNNPQDQESWLTLTLERQSLAVRGEIVRSHQIIKPGTLGSGRLSSLKGMSALSASVGVVYRKCDLALHDPSVQLCEDIRLDTVTAQDSSTAFHFVDSRERLALMGCKSFALLLRINGG